jgi:outer membrane immunogenic protein
MHTKQLRRCLALVPAVALLGGMARADGPFGHPVVPEVSSEYGFVPPFTWTGIYFGANIGGTWVGERLIDSASGVSLHDDNAGFMGGIQLGYNYQIRNAVIGAEWDVDWMSFGHRGFSTLAAPIGVLQESGDTHSVTTLAGRVGVVGESWLAYLKGGWGWASGNISIVNLTSGAVASVSATDDGWLIGGGFEYALTANWLLKTEFDYLGLPGRTIPGFGPTDRISGDHNLQMFKVGLNYKF